MQVDSLPKPARTFRVVLAIFALGVVLRLPTFSRSMLSDDEAIYATTADALTRGDLLYRDVVDHKPPLVYHVYQLGFALLGPYDTHGAHALVVVAVLLTAGFLLAMARRRADARAQSVGLAAAGLFLIFSTTWHDYDALSANCELFLLAPQAAAGWLLLRGLAAHDHSDGRSPPAIGMTRGLASQFATHLFVGTLIGLAALFKYQALTFLGASIGTVLWSWWLRRIRRGQAALAVTGQVVGAALPAALYLAGCAAAGNAAAAIDWFRFNFSYVAAGLGGTEALARGVRRTAMIGTVAMVPYGLGIAAAVAVAGAIVRALRGGALASRGTRTESATEVAPTLALPALTAVFGLLWLATSAVALSVGGRFFGHYFHLVLAPLCLLAAPAFDRLLTEGRSRRAALLVACAVPAAAFFLLATVGRPLGAAMDGREPPYEQVAALIADVTTPDQRIFVWGNSPQLYVEARRPMGARFSFCNYMTGESPGTPTETGQRNADANQYHPAWEMLFADLEQRRPALFVDASAAGWDGYDKYPLARYPRLGAYVDSHYRRLESRAGVVLYQRR